MSSSSSSSSSSSPRTREQQEIIQFLDDLLVDIAHINRIFNDRGYLKRAVQTAEQREATDEEIDEILAQCLPWIRGDRNIMKTLLILTKRCEAGGLPTATEVYNILFVMKHLEFPQVMMFAYETRRIAGGRRVPDWDLRYLLEHLPFDV